MNAPTLHSISIIRSGSMHVSNRIKKGSATCLTGFNFVQQRAGFCQERCEYITCTEVCILRYEAHTLLPLHYLLSPPTQRRTNNTGPTSEQPSRRSLQHTSICFRPRMKTRRRGARRRGLAAGGGGAGAGQWAVSFSPTGTDLERTENSFELLSGRLTS